MNAVKAFIKNFLLLSVLYLMNNFLDEGQLHIYSELYNNTSDNLIGRNDYSV